MVITMHHCLQYLLLENLVWIPWCIRLPPLLGFEPANFKKEERTAQTVLHIFSLTLPQ